MIGSAEWGKECVGSMGWYQTRKSLPSVYRLLEDLTAFYWNNWAARNDDEVIRYPSVRSWHWLCLDFRPSESGWGACQTAVNIFPSSAAEWVDPSWSVCCTVVRATWTLSSFPDCELMGVGCVDSLRMAWEPDGARVAISLVQAFPSETR